jgi:CRISPR-associated endonuclease/helicase Cas3
VLDRDKDFMHPDNFIPSDEHFTTRLGEAGRIVDLPEGTVGPFGKEIRRLVIPAWWQTGVEEPSFLRVENNQIQFEPGGTRVACGRHGLLRMAT